MRRPGRCRRKGSSPIRRTSFPSPTALLGLLQSLPRFNSGALFVSSRGAPLCDFAKAKRRLDKLMLEELRKADGKAQLTPSLLMTCAERCARNCRRCAYPMRLRRWSLVTAARACSASTISTHSPTRCARRSRLGMRGCALIVDPPPANVVTLAGRGGERGARGTAHRRRASAEGAASAFSHNLYATIKCRLENARRMLAGLSLFERVQQRAARRAPAHRKYLRGEKERMGRQAFVRVLRSDRPLSTTLRKQLAALFDYYPVMQLNGSLN